MLPIFPIILAVLITTSNATENLTVVMALSEPYLMLKDYDGQLSSEYEGFSVDLLKELEQELGVSMTIKVVDIYGVYQESLQKWTGMVGEVADGSADMAIADLTVTEVRDKAIDFSIPFMTGGITILSKKPIYYGMNISFLDPFLTEVWLIIAVSYLILGIVYIVLKIIKKKKEKSEENKISVISLPILKITTIIFTIFLACFYSANLSNVLASRPVADKRPIWSVDDLATQNTIKYGAVKGGLTMAFFKESDMDVYQRLWSFMDTNSDSNMNSNKEGIEKVRNENGKYAFLMESRSAEYVTERKCDLETVGGLLNEFHYAIGLPLNSEYRKPVNQAILKFKSSGIMKKLEKKWWKQKRGGGSCSDWILQGSFAQLNLANIAGVFWMLLTGFIMIVLAIGLEVCLANLGA